jgi:hypothetical protein
VNGVNGVRGVNGVKGANGVKGVKMRRLTTAATGEGDSQLDRGGGEAMLAGVA